MTDKRYPDRPAGIVFVVSGPSGSGKGTVIRPCLERVPDLRYSVSATTRELRPDEIDGVHYCFVSRAAFEDMLVSGRMLEHTEYAGNLYGTPCGPIDDWTAQGLDVIVEVEVEGTRSIRAKMPEAVLVLVIAPTLSDLATRLRSRGTEDPGEIAARSARYGEELKAWPLYDYLIVNDDRHHAAEDLAAIIVAERLKLHRLAMQRFIDMGFGGV